MADGGYLVPPSQDATREKIWTETKKRLDRFLPDLFQEIFPPLDETKAAASAPVSAVPSPAPETNVEPEAEVAVANDEPEAADVATSAEEPEPETPSEAPLPVDKGKKAD